MVTEQLRLLHHLNCVGYAAVVLCEKIRKYFYQLTF
jgi:hypothetical protein